MDQETVDKLSMLILYNRKMVEYYQLFVNYEIENNNKKFSCGDIGSKMKEIIDKEDAIYKSLNFKQINQMLHFAFNGIGSVQERQRLIGHLTDNLQRIIMANTIILNDKYSPDEGDYISMLDSIVDVDSLTRINTMINTTAGIDKDSQNELMKHWKLSKYIKLSRNSYIEKIAIDNNFDITKIKLMTFEKIKETLSDETIAAIEHKYIIAIEGELQALSTLDKADTDPLIRTYTAMTALVNIEIRLEFLSIEGLIELKQLFINEYGNSKNEQMVLARQLILKKEEELSN